MDNHEGVVNAFIANFLFIYLICLGAIFVIHVRASAPKAQYYKSYPVKAAYENPIVKKKNDHISRIYSRSGKVIFKAKRDK